jgi:hypothetical protein
VLDSPLLYLVLQRRLRAIVLLTLLDTVSSLSFICVAHLSFSIQPQKYLTVGNKENVDFVRWEAKRMLIL